ncbi:hypothetical protein DPMN_079318 [Dreissena polymorpha]|uniref:Uncharacterized protein n=1 Tax=Dreissena polymorpha TaxID=45954 RepID=A0A9D3YPB4_DREPO|nr:hypothetical protein DPMN_079318 [Dreissena polymorpha]
MTDATPGSPFCGRYLKRSAAAKTTKGEQRNHQGRATEASWDQHDFAGSDAAVAQKTNKQRISLASKVQDLSELYPPYRASQ